MAEVYVHWKHSYMPHDIIRKATNKPAIDSEQFIEDYICNYTTYPGDKKGITQIYTDCKRLYFLIENQDGGGCGNADKNTIWWYESLEELLDEAESTYLCEVDGYPNEGFVKKFEEDGDFEFATYDGHHRLIWIYEDVLEC